MADQTTIGGKGHDGELHVRSGTDEPLLDIAVGTHPRRRDAEVQIGGGGRNGVLRVRRAADGRQTTISDNGMSLYGHFSINSGDRNPVNINPAGDEVKVLLGDSGVAGYVQMGSGSNGPGPLIELSGKDNAFRMGAPGVSTSTIEIIGTKGRITAGGEGVNGAFVANGADGSPRVRVSAGDASVRLGGSGVNGTVSVLGADGQPLLELLGRANECVLGLGQRNRPARISLYDAKQAEAIKLDAAAGDILLANADVAELFDVSEPAEPGSVLVIGEDGSLRLATTAYDTRVAGIVSGAGEFKPGLVLDQRTTGHHRVPVALAGKAYCLVDARRAPIRAGDLLTTSTTPGHAQSVADPAHAAGAVVGKALAPLSEGCGQIPVLVSLQ